MAFIKCVVSFFRVGESASFERFRSRMPVEECNDNLGRFKKTLSGVFFFFFFFWLTEACQRHGLGDFELKLFRLSKLSKESYAIQTQFQWNTKSITKTYLYNFDPLNPHFYIVKLGFTGVYVIFLISAQKHRLWYSLEPPRRGGSNEYPQSMF